MDKNNSLSELGLTAEELNQYIDEINEEYDNWNINIQYTIDKLSDENKIFLNDFIKIHGEKILYIIYGYLTSDSLLEYDSLTNGGVNELFKASNRGKIYRSRTLARCAYVSSINVVDS